MPIRAGHGPCSSGSRSFSRSGKESKQIIRDPSSIWSRQSRP